MSTTTTRVALADVSPVIDVIGTDVDLTTFTRIVPASRVAKADAMSRLAKKFGSTAAIPDDVVEKVKNLAVPAYSWLATTDDTLDISGTELAALLDADTLDDDHRGVVIPAEPGTDLPTSVVLHAPGLVEGDSVIVSLHQVTTERERTKRQSDGTRRGTGEYTYRTHAEAVLSFGSVAGKVFTLTVRIAPRPTGLKVSARLV